MIEKIEFQGDLFAIIVRREFSQPGVTFFTPADLSQQLAYMKHPVGKKIEPHVHNPVLREVSYTQEVLIIQRGRLRVDFYNCKKEYLCSRELQAGDVVLLSKGGHGFNVLEEVEMFEVKQGPYAGEEDKTRFSGVTEKDVSA